MATNINNLDDYTVLVRRTTDEPELWFERDDTGAYLCDENTRVRLSPDEYADIDPLVEQWMQAFGS